MTTTTVEKLFVQIFDRKKWIVEQVKQQTDLYTQQLASKLIIDGITPPPWLWNPNFNSQTSDPKGLKKEELISELLLPHPRPVVPYPGSHCSLYNKPIVVRDNGELSEGLFMECHVSNKGFNTGNRPTTMPECHDNDNGCALNCVPELDLCATSPQEQIEANISNIYNAPDQSLARIQRSKSRQKALELRKFGKAAPKSRFTDEKDTRASSSGIKGTASQQLEHDNGLPESTKFSDIVSDDNAGRREKGECLNNEKDTNIYCGRITRSRSSCNLSCQDIKSFKVLNSSDTAKEDRTRTRTSQSNCIGVSKSIHSCYTASQRVEQSKSGASKKFLLSKSLNRLEGSVLENALGSEVILHSPDALAIVKQVGKTDYVTETKDISDGPVEAWAACSKSNLDAAGLSIGLDGFSSMPPPDCSMFVKPKTLHFDDVEKCILNETFNTMLEKERLDESSEKRCCTSVKSATLLGKNTFDKPSRKSLEMQSLEKRVSRKTAEAWRVSFQNCVEVCVEDDEEVSKSDINKNLNDIEKNSDGVQDIQNSHGSCESNVALSIVDKGPDVEGFESSTKLQVEEGGALGCDARDKSLTKHSTGDQGCLVEEVRMTNPNSIVLDGRVCYVEDNQELCVENKVDEENMSGLACSERTLLERKSHVVEDGLLACDSVDSLCSEDKNLGSKIRELQIQEKSLLPGRRLRSAVEDSWPPFKRRMIESQQTKETQTIGRRTTNRCLKSDGDSLETVSQFQCFPVSHEGTVAQSNDEKSPEEEMNQKVNYHLPQGLQHLEQDEFGYEEINKSTNTPSTSKLGQFGPLPVSSLTKEAAGDSHGYSNENAGLADTTSTVLDVRKLCDEQNYKNLLHSEHNVAMENKDDLTYTEGILPETKLRFEEDGLFSFCSVASPQDKHLVAAGADQNMPEFEGFIIDTADNEQPHNVGDSISFDKLDLPNTTIKRASVLERLCKSASMHTPLSQFSATFKLHGTPNLYQSVPNGLLGCMDFRSTLNLNDKQHRATYSCMDEMKCAFQGVSYSDCVPDADAHFDCSLEKPHLSPVGRFWDRISLNPSSSEKQRNLNPELTCFPIEEDPSISGENENRDEMADAIQEEDICSTLMSCGANREPLAEITEACANPPASDSAAQNFTDRSSLDSANTEVSFTGTHARVKQRLINRYSNRRSCTNEAKENHTRSVRTNCIKKDTGSLNNRFSKPKLSGKSSLRKDGQSLSDREAKRNNIVSNITSFVPLIQQKQSAAVGRGKRDIKVKALEAAEAAKRLEEKRQNERNTKKETLKLERARIMQENLQQMELQKKKKEEEQKKKDADIAARKRLRGEEERKEKERKRRRIEETRRHQREQEEKLRPGKVEKEDEKTNWKESKGELRKHQKMEKERGENNMAKKPETESKVSEIPTSNVKQAVVVDFEASSHYGETGEPTSVLTKTIEKDDVIAKTSQEKSYEISPYQCSDDEEDEEDQIPTRKFIPSWTSKSSVALVLLSQQKVDPYIIFPPGSFCSMDEVLRPRKLQAK